LTSDVSGATDVGCTGSRGTDQCVVGFYACSLSFNNFLFHTITYLATTCGFDTWEPLGSFWLCNLGDV